MGTWMCHLRLAEALLSSLLPNAIHAPAFCFGNLAPDSGIPNADWTQFDPPKEITHFLRTGEGENRIRDLSFYREFIVPHLRNTNSEAYSFLLGYFCHLLCDGLWSRRIGTTTKQLYATQFQQDKQATWEMIKTDWYDLDHRYVRDHRESVFWRIIVPTPNPRMYVSLVPTNALHQQLNYIREFYSHPKLNQVLDRPYPYLNEQTMSRFIQESYVDISNIFIQLADNIPTDVDSALVLLGADRVEPYASPLGDVSPT